MIKKVLITGGAGFIGYHLSEKLLQYDYQIDIVDNFQRGRKDFFLNEISTRNNISLFDLDLLNINEVNQLTKNYDYIFHFAAIIGVQNVLNNPYLVLDNNVKMLSNIISVAKKQDNLKKLIFTSTSEVYAGTLEKYGIAIPTPESENLVSMDLHNPRSSYMLSKIYGEAMLQHSNIPYVILRPHNIYGPRMGMDHVIPQLLNKAYSKNLSFTVFSPKHTRTFCYIDDAIEMILEVMINDKCTNKTYNLGTEQPEIKIQDLAEMVLDIVGNNKEINFGETTLGSPSRRCPDMTKLFSDIQYRPRWDLKEGINKTFSWYREFAFIDREEY